MNYKDLLIVVVVSQMNILAVVLIISLALKG